MHFKVNFVYFTDIFFKASALMQMDLHRYEYRWADGIKIKKPIEVSAPKYVEYLMDWIESLLDDESVFPQKLGMGVGHCCSNFYFSFQCKRTSILTHIMSSFRGTFSSQLRRNG